MRLQRLTLTSVSLCVAVVALAGTAAQAASPPTPADSASRSSAGTASVPLPPNLPSAFPKATPGTSSTKSDRSAASTNPSHDEIMRLKAQAEANRTAPQAGKRSATDRSAGAAASAALYAPDFSVSVLPGVEDPSMATFQGVHSWRVQGGTVLFGNLDGYRQQFVQWGKSLLIMQTDGNLVLYDENRIARWWTGTQGNPGAYAYFQTDGNLVVYSANHRALRASGTCCHAGWKLHVQADGNMVIYAPVWVAQWYTNTAH